MEQDKAYQKAEQKIKEARRTDATKLNLGGMKLRALPESLGQLTQLQTLSLQYNRLTALPEWLGQLTQLQTLFLYGNQLTALPESLGQLTQLQTLDLQYNRLTALPEWLGQLTQLQTLDLKHSRLTALPESLGQLTQLRALNLSGNQLTALPESLGQLTQLRALTLYGNQLTALPECLGQLTQLQALHLGGNPLTGPPRSVVAQGTKAVLAYLREKLEQGKRPQWRSKVILVGEAGVGKTSLLRAMRGLTFRKGEPTTHGLQIVPFPRPHPEIASQEMDLTCWDFGGQHVLHATHQFFLTDRALFVLVWNARVGWEQSKLYYWLDVIKATDDRAPVLIVATHTEDWPAKLPWEDIQAKYPQVKGQFALSNEDRDETAFALLFDAIDSQAAGLPMMGQKWPATWLNAADALSALEKKGKTIKPKDFLAVLRKHKVKKDDCAILAKHLHALGDILDFRDKDDPALRDTVILDSEWIAQRISHMLAQEDIALNQGVFTRDCMKKVWPKISWETRDLFLALMEQFDLSFRTLEQEDISFVVEHLPLDAPGDVEALWDMRAGDPEVAMTYRFAGSLPPGIPTWFIARSHRFTALKHWRYGALLKYDGETLAEASHLALVRADDHKRFLTLNVRGPEPINFFAQLRDTLELTLGRYSHLEYTRKVPCPERDEAKCGNEFDFEGLRKRLANQRYDLYCEDCGSDWDVRQLLFGLVPDTRAGVHDHMQELLKNQQTMLAQHKEQNDAHEKQAQLSILIRKQNERIRQLIEFQHYDFLAQFRHLEQSKLDAMTPRVFLLGPKQKGSWAKWLPTAAAGWGTLSHTLGGKKLVLRLLCEAPGCWHTLEGDAGTYEIQQPAKWLEETAPLVKGVAEILQRTLPVAAAGADFAGGLGIASAVGSTLGQGGLTMARMWADELKFMDALVKTFPKVGVSPEGMLSREMGNKDAAGLADGNALTALQALLTEHDPKGTRHGLKRIVMESYDICWVCEAHYQQFKCAHPPFKPLLSPDIQE